MSKPLYTLLLSNYSMDRHVCPDVATSENQCAIRLSRAMIDAGIGLSGYTGNVCRHGYARGAQDLGAYLRRQWGVFDLGFSNPGTMPTALASRYGVIMFANIPGFSGQGHIDLWDGSQSLCGSGACPYWQADPIWFWELAYSEASLPTTKRELTGHLQPLDDPGKCGARQYPNIDQRKLDIMMQQLRDQGCDIRGNNPWDVDTHSHHVRLRGAWDEAQGILTIIVTDKGELVPCSAIWDKIHPPAEALSRLS